MDPNKTTKLNHEVYEKVAMRLINHCGITAWKNSPSETRTVEDDPQLVEKVTEFLSREFEPKIQAVLGNAKAA